MRKDILQKIPGLDTYFDRTVAPEDNVSDDDRTRICDGQLLTVCC